MAAQGHDLGVRAFNGLSVRTPRLTSRIYSYVSSNGDFFYFSRPGPFYLICRKEHTVRDIKRDVSEL